jgi:uncharacterized protein (DUF1330 family)
VPAYVVAEVHWKDDAARAQYVAGVGPTVEAYGGRIRVGPAESLEGDWQPGRLAFVEFDTAERARAWYDSAEYGELKALRLRASDSRTVLVTLG